MSEELFRIVYRSTHGGFNKDNLEQLAEEARSLSAAYGITGFVLVEDEDFFVLLEGRPVAVVTSLACIVEDPRHEKITVLSAGTVTSRSCSGWSVLDPEQLTGAAELARDASGMTEGSKMQEELLDQIVARLAEATFRYAVTPSPSSSSHT